MDSGQNNFTFCQIEIECRYTKRCFSTLWLAVGNLLRLKASLKFSEKQAVEDLQYTECGLVK